MSADTLDFYLVRYPGAYLAGRAVVRAYDERNAYDMLKENYSGLSPFDQCTFKKIDGTTVGVLDNWDGDY